MPLDTVQTVAPTQADPKVTANNIVNNATQNGKTQNKEPEKKVETPVDPNAGKKKYVVDGQEVYLTPEEVDTWAQKAMGYEKKLTKFSHLQQEMNAFMQTLVEDPMKILTDKRIGLTPEAVLEKIFKSKNISDSFKEKVGQWYYENAVEPLKMTPEQLKAKENEKWRAEREAKDKFEQEEFIKRENMLRVSQAMNQIKAQISEAMKDSGLPNNDSPLGAEMARQVAEVMRVAHLNRQSITPKEAITFVKQRIKQIQLAYYDSLSDEDLFKELGDKNVEKIKKKLLKMVKENSNDLPKTQGQSKSRRTERDTFNHDDLHDYLDEIKRTGIIPDKISKK